MVAAQARRVFNTQTQREVADASGTSQGYVKNADAVLDWVPGLAADVVSGAVPLNKGYNSAHRGGSNLAVTRIPAEDAPSVQPTHVVAFGGVQWSRRPVGPLLPTVQ